MALVEDRRRLVIRLTVVQYAITGIFAVLALSFWWVQVIEHQRFYEMAENNHQRTLALRAPRGVLFDRDGRPLVENRDSFRISILREHTHDLGRTIRLLAAVTGLDEHAIRRQVDRHRREPTFRPIVIVEDASLAQVAAVTARRLDFELPDVIVERVPVRRYPTDALAAHAFGYVGEVGESQMEAEGLASGAIVGQSGIERTYNQLLMGEDGARRVVVNSVGREIKTLEEVAPAEGRRIKLTIDYDLQRAAEDGFRELGYNGAAAVLDPSTGEVLALVSLPAYDPNAFAGGIDRDRWTALNVDELKPLQNRAIQGRYEPGSTFKIAVATAALEEGIVKPDFKVNCAGGANFYGRYFKCHLKGGHGTLDMRHAIEQSCNVYFYTLGNMIGIDRIHKWATALGLGQKSGIDLPNEVEGLVPSTQWKLQRRGEKWYAGETISVSIGQGQVWVTPISMAVMIATVANGGTRLTPHFVKAVDEGKGWQVFKAPEPDHAVKLKPETVQVLHDGLWLVVNGAGTGARGRIPGRDVAGKTGTAQVISIEGKQQAGKTDKDLRDHGWFLFFAPKDNPQIAGVIFAEHAEHGYLGAPIARHVIETFFAKKEGRPLPPFNKAPFLWAAAAGAAAGQ
ncbi:MAG: penicillin-binding protein 2 [Acidobacteria bacterium]|nr:penicillin-binding protein 2 [Acidobacteriota bacterium]